MNRYSLVFLFGLVNNVFAQADVKEVGIPDNKFYAHAQEKSNWCWAASIQMVLEYKNIYKTQNEIILRTFGRNYNGELPNLGGSIQNISANLNNWEADLINRPAEVTSNFFSHPPSANELVYFLKKHQPIYISYKSGLSTNHAIVITSCRYKEVNGGYEIIDFTARDPWPSSENIRADGLVKYNYSKFYPLLNYFWIISVRLKGHVSTSDASIRDCNLPFCIILQNVLNDYSNDFDNLKGESITSRMFKSRIKFPSEISSRISEFRGLNYEADGKALPHYTVSFYRGTELSKSKLIFEDLKSNFEAINIVLEETTRLPFNNERRGSQNKTIHIHLENGKVISLKWRYLDAFQVYSVEMVIQSEDEVKQLFQ